MKQELKCRVIFIIKLQFEARKQKHVSRQQLKSIDLITVEVRHKRCMAKVSISF
jgi:hypothetical protein